MSRSWPAGACSFLFRTSSLKFSAWSFQLGTSNFQLETSSLKVSILESSCWRSSEAPALEFLKTLNLQVASRTRRNQRIRLAWHADCGTLWRDHAELSLSVARNEVVAVSLKPHSNAGAIHTIAAARTLRLIEVHWNPRELAVDLIVGDLWLRPRTYRPRTYSRSSNDSRKELHWINWNQVEVGAKTRSSRRRPQLVRRKERSYLSWQP